MMISTTMQFLVAVRLLLWTMLLLHGDFRYSTAFAFQQTGDPRIWTTTTTTTSKTTTTSNAAADTGAAAAATQTPLPKPPFPNGANGGQIIVIPGLFDDYHPLLLPRDVTVWLPPQYRTSEHDDGDHRFSVLYCHDGQNVMDDECSWTGASWRLPGALIRLSERGLLRDPGVPPIVVLLPSAQGDLIPGVVARRHLEYGSLGLLANVPSLAQAHADVVATVVKPYIDAHFRTNPHCASAMGSSMGGQASMNLLLRHPDVFSAAACLSPYFAPDTLAAVGLSLSGGKKKLQTKRIYMDMGGDMDDTKVPWLDVMDHVTTKHWWNPGYFWLDTSLQPSCHVMHHLLLQSPILFGADTGGGVRRVHFAQIPGARHNERAWSHRIHQPLLFLYGKEEQQ
jgi:enterochelin esterase-like enzyme